MRILLVDDEPALRELLRVTLESAEVTVDEAGSAREAEERIRAARPDVVVLDVLMPVVSGVDLCRRLKAAPATRDLPIILLTGSDLEDAAGADALVRKPFSPLDLLAVVDRVTGLPSTIARPRSVAGDEEELLLYARDLRHLLGIERRQRALLESSYLETVTALATALEWKDTGTHDHSQRVVRYALELLAAVEPGYAQRERGIEYGFRLHDVGKIAIPDEILLKPARLTADERAQMEQHTLLGEEILGGVALLQGAGLDVVRSHHERWDGAGYPDGLHGPDTPLGARVFAVADALDAMTSDRPYRRALEWSEAREEIVAESGRQFDPVVVEAFHDTEPLLHAAFRETVAA
jgi:response regulator RpfG family c-di-GMP phosphodiesterase